MLPCGPRASLPRAPARPRLGLHRGGRGHHLPRPAEAAAFQDGDDFTFRVILEECISACARLVKTSCEVQVEGTTIYLEARGSYLKPGPAAPCVTLCAELKAECVVPDLAPGTYEIRAGANSMKLALPATGPIKLDSGCGYFEADGS
ncbi:hypothetical protein OV079_31590 [Nannocystis pusilla]|uniref:Uncharacterized protein n=1 Tax=Nannocystis pusilla TaxID=889268 RepID=A0A9X3ETN5_9BACT|nr:hypothetical protein [Nannocystis pusilla]MCY1010028.1 hypothetical protein [Nannocystis pusilla]